ncbi:hypothetical protein NEILACOT_04943 [Neisseria lactamica ATCC 23970]|uniref:Uncharacterized protein n=1 Tax=Neisseria lactamica ATCC 23970 TaxID=546265 RepID=D0WBL6_NEILA|nr:hypothetical protein NEILACOT_04943 [Neisseria lactamica ATCC 23970]
MGKVFPNIRKGRSGQSGPAAAALFFGNGKRQYRIAFIRHTQINVAYALFLQPFGQCGSIEKFGFAQCVVPDADVAEGNRAAYARTDGFGEGFFGGKAFGKVVDGFARLREFKQLFGSEDAPGKRLSEFLFKRMMRLRETISVPMP